MKIGLEKVSDNPDLIKSWGRFGLVCNQASVTANFEPAWSVLHRIAPGSLKALFGPQHGFESTVQDNMIESDHGTHQPTGLPVYSLYSETREPSEKMLANIDTIIIDLLVTGCRIYTYKYTAAACLRAARKFGKKVVVLDRPNPLGGVQVEGNVLEAEFRSFVGEFSIPTRHGLTMAEAVQHFNQDIGAELEVVKLEDWQPEFAWHQLERPWVLSSPNVPSFESLYVFPGMVIVEGTNLSEGRGTTLPFQFIGASYIDDSQKFKELIESYAGLGKEGVFLRPTSFMPGFQKWAGKTCNGVQIHIVDFHRMKPTYLGIAAVRAAMEMGGEKFRWKEPPYEYEYKKNPFDVITGSDKIREALSSSSFNISDDVWRHGLNAYVERVKTHLIYSRELKVV